MDPKIQKGTKVKPEKGRINLIKEKTELTRDVLETEKKEVIKLKIGKKTELEKQITKHQNKEKKLQIKVKLI